MFVKYVSLLLFASFCNALHDSYNFALPAMERRCFYEDFDKSTPVKLLEVFVMSGGSLNVLLTVHGPLSLDEVRAEDFESPIYEEKVDVEKESTSESSTYSTELKPESPGTYGICLDNRSAHFLTKYVQFDVRNLKRPDPIAIHLGGEQASSNEDKEEEAVVRVKETLERIRKGLKIIQVQQQVDRHRLQLHSATNILDNNRVITTSIVETAFFIAAALFQIFFVRRWFAKRNGDKGGVMRA